MRLTTSTTSDVERAGEILSREFALGIAEAPSPAPDFRARFDVVSTGCGVTIGDLWFGLDVDVRFRDPRAYLVDVPMADSVRANTATVYQPAGDNGPQRWRRDCRRIAVRIDRRVLEGELAQMLDAPVGTPVSLERFGTTQGAGAHWLSLVRLIVADTALEQGLTRHPAVHRRLCRSVVSGLLLAAGHRYRELLDDPAGRVVAPRTVRRVADAIRDDPGRLYTLDDLSGIAGVSRRSLQESFQRHLGLSPMSYLRDIRLQRAHRELQAADHATVSVSEIAGRCGFSHLGRFASAYRNRFGVSPSETLRA